MTGHIFCPNFQLGKQPKAIIKYLFVLLPEQTLPVSDGLCYFIILSDEYCFCLCGSIPWEKRKKEKSKLCILVVGCVNVFCHMLGYCSSQTPEFSYGLLS